MARGPRHIPFFLAASLALLATQAAAESEFHATLVSHTSALFDGVDHWNATTTALSARNVHAQNPSSPMTFQGTAAKIRIIRFELNWTEARLSPNHDYGEFYPYVPDETESSYRDVSFAYRAKDPYAAAVLVAEQTRMDSGGRQIELRSVATDPMLAGDHIHQDHGAIFGPDEQGHWRIDGNYVTFRHDGLQGIVSGRMAFYFALGDVDLQVGDSKVLLESHVWSDPEPPGSLARVRHMVWYRLESENATASFAVREPAKDLNSVGFAKDMRLRDLGSMALESYSGVNGSLPSSRNQTGPSTWIAGPLDASIQADQSQAEGRPSYVVTVSGNPTAYSVGGGEAKPLRTAAIAAVPAIPVLVALALYFSEALRHAVTKPAFLLYSKFSGPDSLANGTRGSLYGIIRQTPGQNFSTIKDSYLQLEGSRKAGASSIFYHLWYLEHAGFVKSYRKGRYRRYYDAKAKGADFDLLSSLKNPPRPELAKCIIAAPGINHKQIQAHMRDRGWPVLPTIRHHLKYLLKEDLVRIGRNGADARERNYYPTEKLNQLASFLESPGETSANRPKPSTDSLDDVG